MHKSFDELFNWIAESVKALLGFIDSEETKGDIVDHKRNTVVLKSSRAPATQGSSTIRKWDSSVIHQCSDSVFRDLKKKDRDVYGKCYGKYELETTICEEKLAFSLSKWKREKR